MRYLTFLLALFFATSLMAQYSDQYRKLSDLADAGKYRSARTVAEEIFTAAERAGHADQMVKALNYRVAYTEMLEEDGSQAVVDLLRGELGEHGDKPVVAALVHVMLGRTLHDFAERNSYRLRDATTIAGARVGDSTALADYSMEQLLVAGRDYLYQGLDLARENQIALGRIPALVAGGQTRTAELPTLYDLLIDEAMKILGSSLGSVTDTRLSNPTRLLQSAPAFVRLKLEENYNLTKGTPRKLLLYQQWIAYHLKEGGPALLHADLERMRFVHRNGAPDTIYLAALEKMYEAYAGTPQRDRILTEMARLLDREDEALGARPRVRALELLERVGTADELARVEARQLRASITAPSLQSQNQSYYPRRRHLLVGLTYRNVERVFYRVYAYDPAEEVTGSYRNDERLAALMKGRPVTTGSQRLVANDDHNQHLTELDLNPLPAGGYHLIISSEPDFSTKSGMLTATSFQVTDLAVVKLTGSGQDIVQVVDRTTGASRAGIAVAIRQQNRRNRSYLQVETRRSDASGTFTLPRIERYNNYQLILTDPNSADRLVTEVGEYANDAGPNRRTAYTTLLTDRPIYRPGQTIHVYGLRYQTDEELMPSILPNEPVTVTLRDANYQEVATREVVTDAYGRFSSGFDLPAGGLTGEFSIQTDNGSVSLRVEEYKRPRFEVTLDGPDAATPGEEVTITGRAMTYAGPAVADARVNYRVFVEEVRYMFHYFRNGDGGGGDRELVTSGRAITGPDGRFSFAVITPTDLQTDGYRRYRYVVEADVADATGETHQATTGFGIRGERPAIMVSPRQETVDRGDSLHLDVLSDRRDTSLRIALRIVPVEKPNAAILQRDWSIPDRPVIERGTFERNFPYLAYAPVPDLATWPVTGAAVHADPAVTVRNGQTTVTLPADFPVGHYRVEWTYADGTGGEPTTFSVYSSATADLPAGVLFQLDQVSGVEVGELLELQLISAIDLPLVHHQWQSRRGIETGRDSTRGRRLTFLYTPSEADRGGLSFKLAFVRANRVFEENRMLPLTWENRELTVTYATFRDRLRPGMPERWTLRLKSSDSLPAAAAALATMYDASLDQLYAGQDWQFSPYPYFYGGRSLLNGASFGSDWGRSFGAPTDFVVKDTLPGLPRLILFDGLRETLQGKVYGVAVEGRARMRMNAAPEMAMAADAQAAAPAPPPPPPAVEEMREEEQGSVQIRTNLQETAFWLPEMTAGPDGSLEVSFTSPEALTAWKFRLFAHDKKLNYVISEREIVTQKELMVLPNVPRFLREGDAIDLTVRVSNTTPEAMLATVELELFDPLTDEAITDMGGAAGAAPFRKEAELTGSGSVTLRFPLTVPEGAALRGPLGYRIIARAGNFSDGEENVVPILTDRTLVTVSKPFYLRRKDDKSLTIPGLADQMSPSLTHVSYTFEATTNPAWLALKALPYLMEYPYDCTEQVVNRYFANQLAYVTVAGRPILEEVFRKWQSDSTALLSELEQNLELKNALLTETPWVREAQSESAQRARIADLFQLKRLAVEQRQALDKLAARQGSDGAYSWFPDGRPDRYMTQYVLETLARMRQLGVIADNQKETVQRITKAAVGYLDQQLADDFERLFARESDGSELRKTYQPSALQVHYLYARAMSKVKAPTDARPLDFYRERAFAGWKRYGLYEQALIALTAQATDNTLAMTVIESLRERALHSDEFGMYWKYEAGYRWNNLPIETHTRILEAFRSVAAPQEELDEMRLWLLTNKRTNHWPTTKATAAAVYAILNGGERFVARDNGRTIDASWPGTDGNDLSSRVRALQQTAEAATGEFSLRLPASEVSKELATVEVKNRGNDLVWGGIYWQYTERADRVRQSEAGPLSLERELYRKEADQLVAITEKEPLHHGDRITVRLTLRSDRDMDYVHVKDRRAATFEPVNALSVYRYDNGLGYYFAPGNLATNFFISDLPKGTYVLEYDLFATYAGNFSSGLGRVECMYAPEFGGNTAGGRVVVE
ncbi:alpha-2-macroglobulin [Lewinella sp. JB7]|uniref:alpha-2-macroglobulin family protein n=1 Tax=Lewinella sp. JB7 TaxID=2962887 RepID=UPI0020C9EF8B|nr:alpha-2-macroglobulin family protein [Lewinella sp. JB7]MCP9234907.1 MG2 domain-containing protein [Lewinella sp. JB7]